MIAHGTMSVNNAAVRGRTETLVVMQAADLPYYLNKPSQNNYQTLDLVFHMEEVKFADVEGHK